jgi:16S rRNA (cytosine967-C5)-methyltransferase
MLEAAAAEGRPGPGGPVPWPGSSMRSSGGFAPLAGALSIHHSYPAWMVRRWIDRFGASEAVQLLEAGNRPAASTVRVDPARASVQEVRASMAADGIEAEIRSFPPGFLRVTRGVPRRSKAFAEGLIYIQDEASGIVPLMLAPEPGSTVLDACAAPGGKGLVLARMVGPKGLVVASDLHLSRVQLVAGNAARLGVANIRLLACDITDAPFSRPFDAVLVDAPCSGSGVFRRDPESRYRLSRDDLGALARRQEKILEGVAALVKPGGRLVYAVCSLEPEEGEERIADFLSEHGDFRMDDLEDRLGGRADLIGEDGAMRTLPHRHDMDGFYAAALVRESGRGAS